jgi:hypothetical protein
MAHRSHSAGLLTGIVAWLVTVAVHALLGQMIAGLLRRR